MLKNALIANNLVIRKLQFAVTHSMWTLKYVLTKHYATFENILKFHVRETLPMIQKDYENKKSKLTTLEKISKTYSVLGYPVLLYCFCRFIKPEIVIETGASTGLLTTFILRALEDNGKGLLYSIEFCILWFLKNG